jgi:hypothetical protein
MTPLQAQCTYAHVITDVMYASGEGMNCVLLVKRQVWRQGIWQGAVDVVPECWRGRGRGRGRG